MTLLKKVIAALALLPALACASEGTFPLDHAPDRTKDVSSLQNGAKLFVNYCLNCHSASSMRYNRLRDIGLTEDQIKNNLMFSGEKVGDLMKISLSPQDAKAWFGAAPPDLSVIARAKASEAGSGPDWIYTYLRSYYTDDSRPTGWNNMLFPNVACRMCCGNCKASARPSSSRRRILMMPARPSTSLPASSRSSPAR